jgi:hypothetical protein
MVHWYWVIIIGCAFFMVGALVERFTTNSGWS